MDAFDKLAPFIQDYIYRNKWEELHAVQAAACEIIMDTDKNLLLASPTASGKTEAAFLPVITLLLADPPRSVGVLYVAPLKALINDQFVRLSGLLDEAGMPLTKWHGDSSPGAKARLLKHPAGVMQTTPESLEAMLMMRSGEARTLFSDLRFIIVDEVHSFIAEDRGVQLISLLERLQSLTGLIPRRIGLSATLADPSLAGRWLSRSTRRECECPVPDSQRRRAKVMVSHFYVTPADEELNGFKDESAYYDALYRLTRQKKSVIFSNSRAEVEHNIINLKEIASKLREPDVFQVHHGSISAADREFAENRMRAQGEMTVTGATVTLELGIDLGDLELIVQTGCPQSVSSLAQRLGRSGRRSGIPQMCFVFEEDRSSLTLPVYRRVNWLFVKCLALIELYRENWLEPSIPDTHPYGVLYHQTMSFLYSCSEASPQLLARTFLGGEAFAGVSEQDYRDLLRFMLERGQLDRSESGGLITGLNSEALTSSHEFFSVFETQTEYAVREGDREIGSLTRPLPIGATFVLGGRTWLVVETDSDRKVIHVTRANGKPATVWDGFAWGLEHTAVLSKMRMIIAGEESLPYLDSSAASRLHEIREQVKSSGILDGIIFDISEDTFGLALWLGTRATNAVDYALDALLPYRSQTENHWPFLTVSNVSRSELAKALGKIRNGSVRDEDLILPGNIRSAGKFSDQVPENLLKKQYTSRFTDLAEARQALASVKKV